MSDLHRLYEQMLTIRRVEETLLELSASGELVGTTHTYIGQEAGGVAVVDQLDPQRDVVFSNHRGHGHYLAFTDDVGGLVAEVTGRAGGVCGGKGGSQHLCRGNFYSNGIQGSIVPVATGVAVAERARRSGAVVTVFLGDGTLGQGAVYECLNLAALWRLPMLFVIENNQYAQTTPIALALAGSIPARAEAFGIPAAQCDSTDVTVLCARAAAAVGAVRAAGRPQALVLDTYRFSPHSSGDEVRDPEEIAARRALDPLLVIADRLDPARATALAIAVQQRVSHAVAAARAMPPASP